MEGDQKPDREGYLDFKLAVENGDETLQGRAAREWKEDPHSPKTVSAWYFDLLSAETLTLDRALSPHHREDIAGDAGRRAVLISDPGIREQATKEIAKRIESWDGERRLSRFDFLEDYEWKIKEGVAKRQAENPGEREAESWFWAKHGAEHDYLGYLHRIEDEVKGEIKKIIGDARAQ
jgi:hypothetical protein